MTSGLTLNVINRDETKPRKFSSEQPRCLPTTNTINKKHNDKKTGGNYVLNKLTQTEENITFV